MEQTKRENEDVQHDNGVEGKINENIQHSASLPASAACAALKDTTFCD